MKMKGKYTRGMERHSYDKTSIKTTFKHHFKAIGSKGRVWVLTLAFFQSSVSSPWVTPEHTSKADGLGEKILFSFSLFNKSDLTYEKINTIFLYT